LTLAPLRVQTSIAFVKNPRGHPEDDRVLEGGRLRGPFRPRPGRALPPPGNEDRV